MYSLLLLVDNRHGIDFLAIRERGPSIGHFVLWIAVSAAGFLTHYFFALPWLGMVLFLFFRPVSSTGGGCSSACAWLACCCCLGMLRRQLLLVTGE